MTKDDTQQTPEKKVELANAMLQYKVEERIKLEARFKNRMRRIMQECEAAIRTFPMHYGGLSSPISANDASELKAMEMEHRGLQEQISLLERIADKEPTITVCNCIPGENCPKCTPPHVLEALAAERA